MKITTKEKKVKFGDLKPGETFTNKGDNEVFMKLTNVGVPSNIAIHLSCGWVSEFNPNGFVYKVECELTVL